LQAHQCDPSINNELNAVSCSKKGAYITEYPLGNNTIDGAALHNTCFLSIFVFFQDPVSKTEYCKITLDDANLKAFLYAVKNHYWYQMYLGTKNISIFYCFKKDRFLKGFRFLLFTVFPVQTTFPFGELLAK
jgi:hypothetical protein